MVSKTMCHLASRSGLTLSRPSLQTHANLISNNLQQIAAQLSEHHELFQSTVAFPLPQFPGKERSFILETLLRTKLEPSIEEWIEEGEKIATEQHKGTYSGLGDQDRSALWHWAPGAANKEARRQRWGADYTLEEKQRGIENVVTGLQRALVEPPDDEGEEEGEEEEEEEQEDEYEETDEEDEDKMDVEPTKTEPKPGVSAPTTLRETTAIQMPIGSIHRFMTRGGAPG
jgi:mediator of RNA polymerase II transcription subunit 8